MQFTSAELHEVGRVAAHIEGAELRASHAPPRGLDRARTLVRTLLLQELEDYRRAGVFPKNRDFPDRAMPYFVDAEGTRCAMAHLLELGGASALVAKIASERNNAFVRELADEPQLLAWLDAAGLTVDEAVRIQPSYCDVNANMVCFDRVLDAPIPPSASGVVEILVVSSGPTDSTARVENVFGDGGPYVLGAELQLSKNFAVGTSFVVPLFAVSSDGGADADATASDADAAPPVTIGRGLQLHPGGIVDGAYGASSAGHPLTAAQIADAYRSPNCEASLAALDPWWLETTCYGQPTQEEDAGQKGASSSSSGGLVASSSSGETANPAAADDGGGCSTSGTDASTATVQVLLALVATITARRLARRARGC